MINSTTTWLKLGGRRIDSAAQYANMRAIGTAIKASGVPRGDIYLVSKTGSPMPMGAEDTETQLKAMLEQCAGG